MDDRIPASEESRFLTLGDTARILNISTAQALALVRSGELPAIRIVSSWRIERVALEGYIDGLYEIARRMNRWHEVAYADLAEPLFGVPQPAEMRVVHITDCDMDRSRVT